MNETHGQEQVETDQTSEAAVSAVADQTAEAAAQADATEPIEATSAANSEVTDPATEPTLIVPTEEELEGLPPESEPVIRATIIDGIKAIYDPEIPVNIWDLGLIYKIDVEDNQNVNIEMTLTSPMCPTAQQLVGQVEMAARETPCVKEVIVDLVWEPPWEMEHMSEEARLMLGF
ncbi:MAG: iron-sulfur cluster assembly protein [Myxococcota bacterium]|nr:iron-sulfur cluster assembly protein [Myxococcota bacterium]